MRRRHLLTTVLIFSIPTLLGAETYDLKMSICEINSTCEHCIEDIKATLTVNVSGNLVTIAGKSTVGLPLTELLSNCAVKSDTDWVCDGLRGVLEAKNGRLDYVPTKRELSVDGKKYEVCLK